jgi:predicted RNA-binding protein with PIN domain
MTVVLVDGRNVQRSRWPNVPDAELVERVQEWAGREGVESVVVFDGKAPEGAVGTKGETADDWIAREASTLREPYWLVTSDRELRERAGSQAERLFGGGAFLRELGLAD